MLVYADASALAKLVVDEPESEALVAWLQETGAELATSWLSHVELRRVIARRAPWRAPDATDVLQSCQLIALDLQTYESAARLHPPALRSLDALRLAAALRLGAEAAGMLVYDRKLASAARAVGLRPIAPGVELAADPTPDAPGGS